MTKQDELGGRIAELLDEGAERLGPEERERLVAARNLALARYRSRTAEEPVPALAGRVTNLTEHSVMGIRYALPIAVLVLGLIGIVYLSGGSRTGDVAEIDAGLLTDELPINAYLDQGLDSWLKPFSR